MNGCAKFGERAVCPTRQLAKGYVKFKNIPKILKKPFVIYAVFESILEACDDNRDVQSQRYQKHVPCGYAYKRVATVDKYDKDIVLYISQNKEDDVAELFVESLVKEADEILKIMKKNVSMNLTQQEENEFQEAQECSMCGQELQDDRVRDHDHLTGAYRGAAHNACNLKIPVVFHNLKGYDLHFIISCLDKTFKRITCIPSTTEIFITFSVNLEFIDSLSFVQGSLERLVDSLSQNNLQNITDKFTHVNTNFHGLSDDQKLLLTQKGVYPYDYMDSLKKFEDTSFPCIEDCYSQLNKEEMDVQDYERALKVWDTFDVSNMGEYHDLSLKTDVLLLADVF